MDHMLVIAGLAGALLGALGMHVFIRASAKSMLQEFIERFPGECPICSYHRYGMLHGFIRPGIEPPEHRCLNKEKTDG
jgi:hypothetical protein